MKDILPLIALLSTLETGPVPAFQRVIDNSRMLRNRADHAVRRGGAQVADRSRSDGGAWLARASDARIARLGG
jgi:hypothetical protein